MKTTIFAVMAALCLFHTAITHAQKCAFDPAQQTAGCIAPPIPIIGDVHAVAIFCCPNNNSSATLPEWHKNVYEMQNFFKKVSNSQHNLTIDFVTDGSNMIRSDEDFVGYELLPNETFVADVLTKADVYTDFSRYDDDGDGYVDFVMLICIHDAGRPSQGTVDKLARGFVTNDPWPGHPDEYIRICDRPSIICGIESTHEEMIRLIPTHEYGHHMHWPDMEHTATGALYDHYSLGDFELMATGGFMLRGDNPRTAMPSPPNPWFRQSAGWHTPTAVTTNQIGQEMRDLTQSNESFLYTPASIPGSAAAHQRWYIARFTNESGLYSKWEMDQNTIGGILVFHVEKNGDPTLYDAGFYSDYRKMPIDLETASGKFDWTQNQKPNALVGRDSLENRGVYTPRLIGSNGAFFRPDDDMEFAFYKNPNSNFRYSTESAPYNYAQGVTSGLSVKNITQTGNSTYADILLNDYNITTNGVLYDGRWEVYGTVTVKSGNSLTIENNADVYMQSGCDLIIEDNATVLCNGILNMQQRNIICQGPNAVFVLGRRDGLRGVNEISNGNIVFRNGWDIPSGQTVNFTNGANLQCEAGSDQTIDVHGTMQFATAGFGDGYTFSDCLTQVTVYDGGEINVPQGGVLIENVPTILTYANSRFISQGSDQPDDYVLWRFREDAGLDTYGWLDADWTKFDGTSIDGAQEYWGGIVVVYPESKIELDHCTIEKINASMQVEGCGIHLWQSGNLDNHVANCDIIRADPQDRFGNAIFMQYVGNPSFLEISCTNMLDRWWTGLAVVGSELLMKTSRSNENRVGATYMWSSQISMAGNCVENNQDLGINIDDAELWLMPLNLDRGYNRVVGNANTQFNLTSTARMYGGITYSGLSFEGYNHTGHASRYVKRITLDQSSTAVVENNWWGVSPDYYDLLGCHYNTNTMNDLFKVSGGSILNIEPMLCSAILTSCGIECDLRPPVGGEPGSNPFVEQMFSGASVQQTSSFIDLYGLADAGNFSETYRYLNQVVQNNPHQLEIAANLALGLEQRNARKSSAHKATSANRLFPWLYSLLNSNRTQFQRAALLRVLTEAYFLYGDETNAESTALSLRNQFPGTSYAARVLPYLQLMAMKQRDSVKMNDAIAAMVAEGFSAHDLMIARTMKRTYHRVIPKSQLPKRVSYGEEWKSTRGEEVALAEVFGLRNYPNPFNPSTTIEYMLHEEMEITLSVYSSLGERIAVLESGSRGAGPHRVEFNAPADIPNGVYFYELRTPGGTAQGRMLLTK